MHDVEIISGELQQSLQESETKREGSKSRVNELEIMVQAAETEIHRLRNEIDLINSLSEEKKCKECVRMTDEIALYSTELSELKTQIIAMKEEQVEFIY